MNEKIEVGRLNTLRVNRVSEPGIYLISEDETEVLLPNAYVNKSME
ncbi:MAG: DNA-binding protein, partial [Arcobacter sp.]|nr:DNA-binding protein [Arcobacter sp.]